MIIMLGFGYVDLIIKPQVCRKEALKENIKACQINVAQSEELSFYENRINEENKKVSAEVAYIKNKFFKSIKQEDIIILLTEMLKDSDFKVPSISFSKVRREGSLNIINVTLPFEGSYKGVITFLKKIREYKRKIIISSLHIEIIENKNLHGNIMLDFYGLLEKDENNEFIKKSNRDAASKANPFECFDE